MGVLIDNRQKQIKISPEKIRIKAQAVLDALGCPEDELSILLVNDLQISELNKTFLKRQGPANVISFPMREGDFSNITPQLLGDVVISLETAQKEAATAQIQFESRVIQLLVHGILHLVGYDHENLQSDAAKMQMKEEQLLERICI